jgi:hypothetical protein
MGPARSPLAGPFLFFCAAASALGLPLEQTVRMCSNAPPPSGFREAGASVAPMPLVEGGVSVRGRDRRIGPHAMGVPLRGRPA